MSDRGSYICYIGLVTILIGGILSYLTCPIVDILCVGRGDNIGLVFTLMIGIGSTVAIAGLVIHKYEIRKSRTTPETEQGEK